MAGPSISAMASLLVASTRNGDEDTSGHDQRQQPPSHLRTHAGLREAASSGAERRARALSKHRHVLVRWTAGAATSGSSRRQHFKHADGATCSTTAIVEQSEEVRLQSNHVSPLLSLVAAERLGRHVVAAGTLPAGTLLLRETPFAWSLHHEFSGEFCAHCLHEVTGSTILCPQCGLVAYCSEECATAALREWHGNECLDPCSGAPLEPDLSGMSPACRVALRALRRARLQQGLQQDKFDSKDEVLGGEPATCGTANHSRIATCPDRSSSTAASPHGDDGCDVAWPKVELRHLQEHYTARSTQERELLETEAAIAALLVRGGSGVGSHEESKGEGVKPAGQEAYELLAAELVTTLFKVSTNAFAVSSLRCSEPSFGGHVRPLTHAKVAIGVYLAASMLNHSCTPNALAMFHGGEMRVVATRAIEEGEPVTISYGPLSSKVPSTPERRAYLREAYCFLCDCEACRRPATRTAITPASRSANGEDGDENHPTLGRDRDRAADEASWKRTEFSCCKKVGGGCCPGTLLLGVPRAPSPPSPQVPQQECRGGREDAAGGERIPAAVAVAAAAAPSLSSNGVTKLELWCDHCGTCVPPGSVDALLAENEEDRRLWDELVVAVSRAEDGEEEDERKRSPPSSRLSVQPARDNAPSPAASSALGLVVKRIEWREARLGPLSMRRAIAHDLHARVLATQGDFTGAADACARAVHVLVKIFAPEDQELGVEFLKLAELCFNAGWVDKCNAACRKARLSLEVCLQPGDEQLATLDSLQGLCAADFSSGKV